LVGEKCCVGILGNQLRCRNKTRWGYLPTMNKKIVAFVRLAPQNKNACVRAERFRSPMNRKRNRARQSDIAVFDKKKRNKASILVVQ